MSIWTIFAICFTTLLLITGTAFTLLVFHRADKKMKEAELRGGEPLMGAGAGGRAA